MATLKHVPMKIDKLYKSYGVGYEGKIPFRVALLMRKHPNNFNLFGPRWWTGIVVKTKMTKTATVVVKHRRKHPMLRTKYLKSIKKYHVHDPMERTAVGDKILFEKSRPYSKTKHWIFSAWVQRSPNAEFLANNPEFKLDVYEDRGVEHGINAKRSIKIKSLEEEESKKAPNTEPKREKKQKKEVEDDEEEIVEKREKRRERKTQKN
eukprot:TRINITY_DN1978_c0_g2_i2.p1 TRINITY_DN1978_c0_g2~~TRINITY_DN1978_c0_g2_i2.p1  ORF type:complete len:207 (+),score=58.54 TRINITY_DN1978_c0_g2_i2:21-641(+)